MIRMIPDDPADPSGRRCTAYDPGMHDRAATRPRGERIPTRVVTPERMDDPHLATNEHRRALTGLARLNQLSGSAALIHRAIADLLPAATDPPLRVLDVAAGAGDVAVSLWRRAVRSGQSIEITGIDRSPVAVAEAGTRAARAGAAVRSVRVDACTGPLPTGHDVVMTSLFLHHLENASAVDLLRRMKVAAGRRVVVNDLVRTRANEALVRLAAHIVSRSPVVHADGPQSVRAAFTPDEMLDLAHQAGLSGARLRTLFPCRLLLIWDAS